MKANEFVKKFGWDSAKKVLEVAPIRAASYRTSENNTIGLGGLFGRIDNEYGNIVLLSDLKRLVESWELVEENCGLKEAKDFLRYAPVMHPEVWKLKDAVEDVESCQ